MITVIKIDLFGVTHGRKGAKRPLSYNLSHTSYNEEIWHSYTLPEEYPKSI